MLISTGKEGDQINYHRNDPEYENCRSKDHPYIKAAELFLPFDSSFLQFERTLRNPLIFVQMFGLNVTYLTEQFADLVRFVHNNASPKIAVFAFAVKEIDDAADT